MSADGNDLKPRGERLDDVSAVVTRLSRRLRRSRHTVYFQPVQDVQISTQVQPLAIPVYADRHRCRRGHAVGQQLVAECAAIDVPRRVSEAQEGGLRAALDVNRQRAGQLASALQVITDTLNDAFCAAQISTILGRPISIASCWSLADVPARSVDPLETVRSRGGVEPRQSSRASADFGGRDADAQQGIHWGGDLAQAHSLRCR